MAESPSTLPALDAPLPEKLTTSQLGGELTIGYRWLQPMHFFMAAFVCVWDGFLVFWYRIALTHPSSGSQVMLWFPLLHVAAGLAITYSTLAGFLNRTRVVVGNGRLDVHHGPLPWPGNKTLATSDIRQFFREEVAVYTRGSSSPKYHLSAVTTAGRKVRVVSSVPQADMALYMEQQIEKALGITDQRVSGEMPK